MTADAVANQLSVNVLSVAVIQWLKNNKKSWSAWINAGTPWVTRLVALVTAVATAGAIHFTYVGGTLTVTNLTGQAVVAGVWAVVQNYLAQHVFYATAFRA